MIGIYTRVSTEEQVKHGYSLQDQLRQCRELAETNAYREYVDEGISGAVLNRPGLLNLLDDVRSGLITKVICYSTDRLSRDLFNLEAVVQQLEKKSVLIQFVNGNFEDNPQGKFMRQIQGAVGELEKALITERMSRGRREKARQGLIVKDPKTYGYTFNKNTRQLEINQAEAEIVRLIFDLFTGKASKKVQGINGIAHYLNSQGIPTKKKSGKWHRQVVRQILFNKTYIGEFYQNRWNCEGRLYNKFKDDVDKIPMKERPKDEQIMVAVPAIIDGEQFAYAQRLLDEARRRSAGTNKYNYLIGGLLRCGKCHNTMTGRKSRNWGKDVFEYTDVKNTAGAKFKGCGKRVKMEGLDALIWDTVLNWLNNPEAIAEENAHGEANTISFEEAEVTRITQKLEGIKTGRSRLLNLLADNDILGEADVREIHDKFRQLKDEEIRLIADLAEVQAKIEAQQGSELQQNLIEEATVYYLSRGELSHEDKQYIIRTVVKEILVYDDEVKIVGF